ncbi:MAG: ROK family protein [Bacteroidales bacterium]
MFRNAASIGADIGRQKLKLAVVRMDGTVLMEDCRSMERNSDRQTVINLLVESLLSMRQKAADNGINAISIGISAKGFVDPQSGIVLGPDQGISGWTQVPLSKIVNKETGLPVFVGNDANLMTIAEQRFGAATGYRNVIFVALRTGIGGGIIIDGNLYRGVNNAGGEIGQMIINFSGGISETGIRGSLEYFASGTAVARRYAEEAGLAEEASSRISAREVFNLAAGGDKIASSVVRENAALIGIGLANLITIFAPEIIVLGGGMAEADGDYFDLIRESAFENSLENCRAAVRIERARLGSRASLIGAGYYSLTRLAGKQI